MNTFVRECDIVIIGAGLAGLTAGWLLQGYDCLLLEREDAPGGRVMAGSQQGVSYDLGAIFALIMNGAPIPVKDRFPLIRNEAPLGVFHDGKTVVGRTVSECLNQLGLSLEEREQVRTFFQVKQADIDILSKRLSEILNAFFQVIHPGSIEAYVPARKYDALNKIFRTDYYEAGNGGLTEAFADSVGCEKAYKASVRSVRQMTGFVEVRYEQEGMVKTAHAKKVIVTAPAPHALDMLVDPAEPSSRFLSSVVFKGGTSVVLAFKNKDLPLFSHIAVSGLEMAAVIQQQKGDFTVLTVYFTEKANEGIASLTDEELVTLVMEELSGINIGLERSDTPAFTDVKRWDYIGPVISKESYANWSEQALHPGKDILLAGDYTYYNQVNPMPYGMMSAIGSGQRAAAEVKAYFESQLEEKKYAHEFLLETYMYQINGERPVYLGKKEEGNIAFYGTVLQANWKNSLKKYLLDNAKDGLWEYQHDFGITMEDSALVMEGLLEAGVPLDILKTSTDKLKAMFYNKEAGAFHTLTPSERWQPGYADGRAAYWKGPSIDATALGGYLLQKIDARPNWQLIRNCVQYVTAHQNELGFWHGTWFNSYFLTTYYAARLLMTEANLHQPSLERTRLFMLSNQIINGSWNDSVINTAAAMLTLLFFKDKQDCVAAIQQGAAWLVSRRSDRGWGCEPILYYWYEEAGRKILYHCMDKGQVTSAWAEIALRKCKSVL